MSTTPTRDPALRDALDRQAILDLVAGLGTWLDERRFDDAGSLFTEDASIATPGGTASGLNSLVAQARGNHQMAATHHMASNVVVALDGDEAHATANLLATFVNDADDVTDNDQRGGRYRFALRRTPAGWRIADMEIRQVWRR